MDTQTLEEIRCDRCGSPLKISTSRRNAGKPVRCWKCYKADWKQANAERISKANAEHYKNNREYHIKKAADWRANNLEKHRAFALKAKLKTRCSTPEYYEAKFQEQNGRCGLCGKPQSGRRLDQDHDEKRKKPRGLLCNPCNTQLGQYESLRGRAQIFEAYLLRYEKENGTCTTPQR